jgi:transposase
MCRLHLDAYDHLGTQIAELDVLVAKAAEPFARLIARLVTIPGIGTRTAQVIVAETGGDMTVIEIIAHPTGGCGSGSSARGVR